MEISSCSANHVSAYRNYAMLKFFPEVICQYQRVEREVTSGEGGLKINHSESIYLMELVGQSSR